MLIRHLRTTLTRLVLIGAMAATFAVGGIALGPQQEAAAMTMQCRTLWSQARSYGSLAEQYRLNGDTFNYLIWSANTQAAFDAFAAGCSY
jgi:hypothetical protein